MSLRILALLTATSLLLASVPRPALAQDDAPELTEAQLQLDCGADDEDQDPQGTQRSNDLFLSVFLTSAGALVAGLSVALLVVTYQGGDPADDPDPGLTEEEQSDAELRYIAGLSYGWAFSVTGSLVLGLGLFLLLGSDEPESDTPGFSLGDGVRLAPVVGETWGGALIVDF